MNALAACSESLLLTQHPEGGPMPVAMLHMCMIFAGPMPPCCHSSALLSLRLQLLGPWGMVNISGKQHARVK